MEYKRGVLNCAKSSVVYNASATNLRIIPDFLVVFSYPNVNHWNNSICFMASQDASEPLRTFVLGGFFVYFYKGTVIEFYYIKFRYNQSRRNQRRKQEQLRL